MNTLKLLVCSSILAATTGMPATAGADDGAWYLGAGVGYYDVQPDFKEMAYQAYGGYSFNRYLAAEGTFTYLAEDSIDGPWGGGIDFDAKAYAFSLLPMLPLGDNFALFARLGWASYDAQASGYGMKASDTDDDAYWGAGVMYRFAEVWEVRAEATFLSTGTDDRMGMLSFNYRF